MRRRPRHRRAIPLTEGVNARSADLDLCSIREVVGRLHREDRRACEAVGRTLSSVARAAEAAARALRAGGRLVYIGAGTSGRIGILDAAECPPTFGTRPGQIRAVIAGGAPAISRAVEGSEDDARAGDRAVRRMRVGPKDFVCGISASSRTPFVLGALRAARRLGARTALVCCSPPARSSPCDILVAPKTGAELIAGSTRLKAGTATKLVLNAISTAAMVSLGKVFHGRMVDLQPGSRKLRARAHRIVAELTGLSPSRASALLRRARGQVRLALAMYFTGLTRSAAERELRQRGLRQLERLRSSFG